MLQQLDIAELPVAAAVCSAWRRLAATIGSRYVLYGGCILDGDGEEREERAEALFRVPPLMTRFQRVISAVRMSCFRRRHRALARRLGSPYSVEAFDFDGPDLCVAVACGRGIIVLGPGGALLHLYESKEYGCMHRVRVDESVNNLYVQLGSVYDSAWCTSVLAYKII